MMNNFLKLFTRRIDSLLQFFDALFAELGWNKSQIIWCGDRVSFGSIAVTCPETGNTDPCGVHFTHDFCCCCGGQNIHFPVTELANFHAVADKRLKLITV